MPLSQATYPLNTGSGSDIYKSINSGGYDGALSLFDPFGNLYFSTYIGGAGYEDMEDVKATSDNGLILVGYSSSTGGALELKDFNTGSTDDVYYPGTRQGYILEVDQELNAVWGTKFGSGPAVYERAKGFLLMRMMTLSLLELLPVPAYQPLQGLFRLHTREVRMLLS